MSKTVTIPVELLDELCDVCTWADTFANMIVRGETLEVLDDEASFYYLKGEAIHIQDRAKSYLPITKESEA